MRRPLSEVLLHGAIAGVLAGALVALWFLALDFVEGQPFSAPRTLGAAFFGGADESRRLAAFAALHFGTFAALGALLAALLRLLDVAPGWLVGLAFGLGVLNVAHYVGLLLAGADVVLLLPAGHVAAANLAGGLLAAIYLHRALGVDRPVGPAVLRAVPVLSEGLLTGLIGAAAVALWFLAVDILAGRPFHTPAALGSALLLGIAAPAEVQVEIGVVAAYTVVHLTAFAGAGVLFVLAARRVEREPGLWLLFLLAFIVLEALALSGFAALGGWLMDTLGTWAVGAANLAAVAAMGGWVWRGHPRLRDELTGVPLTTRV